MPTVSTTAMSLFLDGFSRSLEPDVQAVLVLDQAGWHGSRTLVVPDNITLVPLPPSLGRRCLSVLANSRPKRGPTPGSSRNCP